jgi:hypothetical protein
VAFGGDRAALGADEVRPADGVAASPAQAWNRARIAEIAAELDEADAAWATSGP